MQIFLLQGVEDAKRRRQVWWGGVAKGVGGVRFRMFWGLTGLALPKGLFVPFVGSRLVNGIPKSSESKNTEKPVNVFEVAAPGC